MYKVIFDDEKPYEEMFENETKLKNGLRDFYLRNKDSNFSFDAKVINIENGEDISESQFITEMILDIISE